MIAGDTIQVRVFKANGAFYRSWWGKVEAASSECVVVLTRPKNPITMPDKTVLQPRYIRAYYWPDRRHTILEVYEPDGRLYELYADITSPIEIVDGEIHYIDHELDVSMLVGETPKIIDEDEFSEAAATFGYSTAFQAECYVLAEKLVNMVGDWRPLGIDGKAA